MKVKQCDVTIFKSIEVTISKTIYEHEIPILESVFGDGTIAIYTKYEWHTPEGKKYQVRNDDPVVYEVEEIDYEDEYNRLQNAYGIREGSDNVSNVEYIYGRFDERKLEKENNQRYSGKAITRSEPELEDLKESDDMDYESMTKRELKEILDELSVDYDPASKKSALIEMLEKTDKGELEPAN